MEDYMLALEELFSIFLKYKSAFCAMDKSLNSSKP
jgi:hypothetical protein